MSYRQEQLPKGPWQRFIAERLARYHQAGHDAPVKQLAADFGLERDAGQRQINRWQRGTYTGSQKGVKGEFPTDTYPRDMIEQVLTHLGMRVGDLWPELDDDVVMFERYCPKCQEAVTTGPDLVCPWCESDTRRVYKGRKRGKPFGAYGHMTEEQIAAAYAYYLRTGLSVRAIADLIWERFGYSSQNACKSALFSYFRRRGLRLRDQREVTAARNFKHGNGVRGRDEHAYRVFLRDMRGWNSLQGPGQPDCKAFTVKGERCQHHAMEGSEYCCAHAPERQREHQERLLRARATRDARVVKVPLAPLQRIAAELKDAYGKAAAARRLGCSMTTLYNLINGEGSSNGGGRAPRTELNRSKVERYLENAGYDFAEVYPEEVRDEAGGVTVSVPVGDQGMEASAARRVSPEAADA